MKFPFLPVERDSPQFQLIRNAVGAGIVGPDNNGTTRGFRILKWTGGQIEGHECVFRELEVIAKIKD